MKTISRVAVAAALMAGVAGVAVSTPAIAKEKKPEQKGPALKLSKEVQAIIADPAIKAKLEAMGVTPVGNTSAEFQAFIDKETTKWAEVIKAANVPPQ
mgnify:CR=1 FL=1